MKPFEEELKKALSRCEPPADFTARVMREIAPGTLPEPVRSRPFLLASRNWQFAAVAALFLLLASGLLYRQHVQKVKGETAKKQLLVALHIAGIELRQAQLRVKRIEFPEVMQ